MANTACDGLQVLQKELPEEVRPLNTEVTRSNGTRILYFADNVRKQMPAGEQGIDPPRLAVLQACLPSILSNMHESTN